MSTTVPTDQQARPTMLPQRNAPFTDNKVNALKKKMFRCLLPEREFSDMHICKTTTLHIGSMQIPVPLPLRQCKIAAVERQGPISKTTVTQDRQRLSDQLYNRLSPAIEVATMMIHLSEPYFAKILFSQRLPETTEIPWSGRSNFQSDWNYTDDQKRLYQSTIGSIFEKVRIVLCRYGGDPNDLWDRDWGHTRALAIDKLNTGVRGCAAEVLINPSFHEFYSDPDYDNINPLLKRRAHLRLAKLLVHELCHAINLARDTPCRCQRIPSDRCCECFLEPSYAVPRTPSQREIELNGGNSAGELGHAWEYFFFEEPIVFERPSRSTFDLRQIAGLSTFPYEDFMEGWGADRSVVLDDEFAAYLLKLSTWKRLLSDIVPFDTRVSAAERERSINVNSVFRAAMGIPPPVYPERCDT